MNTHDIELPPLPEARIVSYQTDSTMRRMELRTHSDGDMRDYARAAIKPYRRRIEELESQLEAVGAGGVSSQRITSQRRGEPVAWIRKNGFRFISEIEPQDDNEVPLYAAPQPANPDYKQLFEQMCERYNALDAKLAEYSEREPVGYIMPTAIKQLKAGGNAIVGGVSQGFDVPIYTAPQPAEPAREPGNDERAAQGLPPYSPRHLTEEEWNRLTESGRRAWGKKPDEPVRVPSEISRQLLGNVVDEVFDGAIEDVSVIEDIYRVIVREYGHPARYGQNHTIPAGWKLVPAVPTIDMMFMGVSEWSVHDDPEEDVHGVWEAMLAAAPEPPCAL